jgi:protein dithiol oxidoreductase (disulfide-forming)
MNRRDFSLQLTGLGLGGTALMAPFAALAQGPQEGKDFVRVNPGAPVSSPAGQIAVGELFWYGCFEPALEEWVKKLPANVAFRRSPVAFRENPHGIHQRLYFALEAMGKLDAMHRRVFYAMHSERQRLDKPEEIAAFIGTNGLDSARFMELFNGFSVQTFIGKNGLDSARFMELFNGFSVQTKARQASQLADAYKIEGVPALGINGRYLTSGQMAGSPERSLQVADVLVQRALREKKG